MTTYWVSKIQEHVISIEDTFHPKKGQIINVTQDAYKSTTLVYSKKLDKLVMGVTIRRGMKGH